MARQLPETAGGVGYPVRALFIEDCAADVELAVRELRKLLKENYGDVSINISPDSIYTGALGGANFALRAVVN